MFSVYALYNSERSKICIGYTENSERRLARHNQQLPSKTTSYTKKLSGNWKLVYDEPAVDRVAAKRREKQLKSAKGRVFVWDIIHKSAHSSVGRATAS